MESRIAPATLDLTGGVLTFTVDSDVPDAAMSASGGNLTFDAGTGHTITLTGDAAANGFGSGTESSTGSASSVTPITQIYIVGAGGTETFEIQTLSDSIAGLDISSSVENVRIGSSIHTQDIATNSVSVAGAVTLLDDVTITTAGTSFDGDVTFSGAITGSTHHLIIQAGDTGAIAFNSAVISKSVTLAGGTITVGSAVTTSASSSFTSTGDILINGSVIANGATSDLTFTADSNLDGVGGVAVTTPGSAKSGRDLNLTGSLLTSQTDQAIRIENDGANAQLQAAGYILLATTPEGAAHSVALGGYITSTNTGTTTGNIRIAGRAEIIDATSIYAQGGGSITFDSTVNSDNYSDLTLNCDTGNINFLGSVGTAPAHALGVVTVPHVYRLTSDSGISAARFVVTNAFGAVTIGGNLVTTAASIDSVSIHAASLETNGVNAQNGGNILWETDGLSINGVVQGSGSLTIRPITSSQSIGLNDVGDLNLDATEIANLQDGFASITIGRSESTGTITIGEATFHDALALLTPGGTITINDTLATTDATASISLQAKTLKLNLDWGGNLPPTVAVLSTQAADIVVSAGISLLQNTLISTNSGAAGGNVTITGTINGAYGLTIDAKNDALGGEVTFNGVPNPPGDASIGGGTRLASLEVDANVINLTPHTYTSGSQTYSATTGITTHGGALRSFQTGNITLDGPLNPTMNLRVSATGDIIFGSSIEGVSISPAPSLGSLTLAAGGEIRFDGQVGTSRPLAFVSVTSAQLVTVNQAFHVQQAFAINADEVDLALSPSVHAGSFALTSSKSISVGVSSETPGSDALELSQSDVLALADGIARITIGKSGAAVSIDGAVIFHDPVIFSVGTRPPGIISVNAKVTGDTDDGSLTFVGGRTILAADLETTDSGAISLNAVELGADAHVTSNAGAITFASSVVSSAGHDLTVNSTSGAVTFKGSIGNGKAASRPGMIELTSGGTITLASVDAQGLATNSPLTVLRGKITTWDTPGIYLAHDLNLAGGITLQATNGGVTLAGNVESPGRAYSLTLKSDVGNLSIAGHVGMLSGLATLSATTGLTGGSSILLSSTVTAQKVSLKGDSITTTGLIDTTSAQTYTGSSVVSLGPLAGDTTLTVTGAQDVVNTGPWSFTGRATLKSTSTAADDGITVDGAGNNFGDLILSGHNVTIEVDDDLRVRGGSVSAVSGSGGIATLTSFNGSIIQTGSFSVYTLVANAYGGSILFNTGTLKVTNLGSAPSPLETLGLPSERIYAAADVTIIRGGPGTLRIKNTIEAASGDVVIVANHLSSANVVNDTGTDAIQAGGRFLIYAYDQSSSDLTGISTTITSIYPLRYSADPAADGNPANIDGSNLVFARL